MGTGRGVALARVPAGSDATSLAERLASLGLAVGSVRVVSDARGLALAALLEPGVSTVSIARHWGEALGNDAWAVWILDGSSSSEAAHARGASIVWEQAYRNGLPTTPTEREPGYWQPAVRALGEALASDVDLEELLDLLEQPREDPLPLPGVGDGPLTSELVEDQALIEKLVAALGDAASPLQRVFLEEARRHVLVLQRPLSPGQRQRARSYWLDHA
jgi:hypothetical protein